MKHYLKWLDYLKGRDFMILSDVVAEVEKQANSLNAEWSMNKLKTRLKIESDSFVTTIHVRVATVGLSTYFNVEKIYHYEGGLI